MPLSNRVCFLVNLRDHLSCQHCGKQPASASNYHQGFEYHHLIPRSQGGSDEVSNIVLLCRECHQQEHRAAPTQTPYSLEPPVAFHCNQCQKLLDPSTVEMNCGWYCCAHCHQTTHLFTHFLAP